VVAGFGVATLVFGLSQNFVLSMVALGFTGAFDNVSMVIRGSLVPLLRDAGVDAVPWSRGAPVPPDADVYWVTKSRLRCISR
jgi:hypothetical protein